MLQSFAPRREQIKKMILKEQKFPQELWDAFAEAGFLGALVPEAYGGSNAGLLSMAIACEAMGSHGFGSALLILTAMDTACIVRNGSEELKKRILPGVAEGKLKLCFAVTEPNAGSNTFRITTIAKKTSDGKHYRLNGEKTFITGANVADRMLLVCRTMTVEECKAQGLPKAYGLSLLLIDPKTKGITLTPLPTRGIEGFVQFSVHFEDALVPVDTLVGEQDAGAVALFTSLNPERILAGALAVGLADYVTKKAVAYSMDRKVFGDEPIATHQAISHPLAEVQVEIEATRNLVYKSAWAFDQGMEPGEVGFYANCAKFKAARVCLQAVDRAIQTHGGSGFSEDVGLIYYWETARLLKTAPITEEMILNYVAEHKLGMPRSY
ncbi:MAG TPA: acyl-CoA dehydrogenase family protein, partial [Myxococcales bacterium]|nr:acyl-CoA dehydrogenase family protein [Myxococcales bacterium]